MEPPAPSNRFFAAQCHGRRCKWRRDIRRAGSPANIYCDGRLSTRSVSPWISRSQCVRVPEWFQSLGSFHVADAGDAAHGVHHALQLFLIADLYGHVDYRAIAATLIVGAGFQAADIA